MKKSITLVFIMSFALLVLSGCKEKKNEPVAEVPVQSVTLSKTSYVFTDLGETLQLKATVLPEDATNPKITWNSSKSSVATVSDNGLVTSVGYGITTIIATADGKIATCEITVEGIRVKDICKNTYNCVKIGKQVWMAENMRCNKYDTDSERKGAEITLYAHENPEIQTYNPYCIDASEKELWEDDKYAGSLSSEQIEKLGYLYNWAAAVGLKDESAAKEQTAPFDGNRQGICPNGWHVPTADEWDTLCEAIGGTKNDTGKFPEVGKKLKTTSGWYKEGNGTDEYSFAALPAGYYDIDLCYVGYSASFWTATRYSSEKAYHIYLSHNHNYLQFRERNKYYAFSVRCVKN